MLVSIKADLPTILEVSFLEATTTPGDRVAGVLPLH